MSNTKQSQEGVRWIKSKLRGKKESNDTMTNYRLYLKNIFEAMGAVQTFVEGDDVQQGTLEKSVLQF